MKEWKILPSNTRMKISRKSYWNILNFSFSFSFFLFYLSKSALFKGAVLLVAIVELDKEEQWNAAEGRGYANENGWVRSLRRPILDNQWNSLFTLFKIFSLSRIRDFLL